MYSINFWKSWPDAHQRLFWFFASVAVLSLGYLWYGNFTTPSPVIEALRTPEIDAITFDQHTFRIGPFQLSLPADALIILERTTGGLLTPNTTGAFIFLSILVISLLGMLTVITTLSRFWFFTGLSFFTFVIIAFRIETISLFNGTSYVPTAIVALSYIALACYFSLVNSRTSFYLRLVAFILLTIVCTIVFHLFSAAPNPFARISANGLVVGTALLVIFIFTAAHEILAALINVISRGTKQKNSLRHFLIISAVYLVNLALIYANRKFLIQWEFLPINLMIFITLSGILGLWGFRQREPQYEAIFKANPSGVFFYLCLASIGFVTVGYFFATANDPVVRLSEDAILYSHLGYGIIFMIYAINNFGSMLYKNLHAYKLLYRPEHMPYFTFRLAGLICTFVFFAYSNWKTSVNQVYSGYYNAWGDVYLENDTLNLSESYFKKSANFSIRNYHAHYALAQLAAGNGDILKEQREYGLLVNSRPLDLGYLNLSTSVQDKNSPQTAMNVLRDGLKDFPNSGRLTNELALDFASIGQYDSALRYLDAAVKSSEIKTVAETNRMGLLAKYAKPLSLDSLLSNSDLGNSGVKTNALALALRQGSPVELPPVIRDDSTISVYQILSLHNYLMAKHENLDTALVERTIRLARKNENPYYRDFLLTGASFALYNNSQTARAIKLLREAAFAGQVDNLFNALGLWCLEQNVPESATRYFDEAIKQEYHPAVINRIVSLLESRDLGKADESMLEFASKNPAEKSEAATIAGFLQYKSALDLPDDENKYLFIRYRVPLLDIKGFEEIINQIANPEWRVKAVVDRSIQLDEAGESEIAYATIAGISGVAVKDPALFQEVLHLQLRFAAQQKNWKVVEKQIANKQLSFTGKYRIDKLFLETVLEQSKLSPSDSTSKKALEIKRNLEWLLQADPFFEDAVVEAVKVLGKKKTEKLRVYSHLVAALDLNPNSVKLLREYAIMSLDLDFPDAGQTTLDSLKAALSKEAFVAFLRQYPELFQVGPN